MTDAEETERASAARGSTERVLAEIGQAIRAERQARGWSLRALAERASVSASLLSAVENGKIVPTVASLFSVAAAFGVPPQQLFPKDWREEPTHAALPEPAELEPSNVEDAQAASEDPGGVRTEANQQDNRFRDGAVTEAAESASDPTDSPPPVRATASSQVRPRQIAARARQLRRRPPTTRSERPDVRPEAQQEEVTQAPPDVQLREEEFAGAIPPPRWRDLAQTPDWVTRAADRRSIEIAGGLRMIQVVPNMVPGVELVELEFPPGSSTGNEMLRHSGLDIGIIVAGELTIERGFECATLRHGDSVQFDGTYPHRLSNQQSVMCRVIWLTVGPAGPRP